MPRHAIPKDFGMAVPSKGQGTRSLPLLVRTPVEETTHKYPWPSLRAPPDWKPRHRQVSPRGHRSLRLSRNRLLDEDYNGQATVFQCLPYELRGAPVTRAVDASR